MLKLRKLLPLLLVLTVAGTAWVGVLSAAAPDEGPFWPRFHGPKGDNHSPETGLMTEWPEGGPKLLWTVDGLGFGYSSVTLAHNMIYTIGNVPTKDSTDEKPDFRNEVAAIGLDGKRVWVNNDYPAFEGHMRGSRSTPTVDGDRLYIESPVGDVYCLDAKTGKKIWGINILEKFNAPNITWALSESLLIDGDNVICCPFGPETAVVALNKNTGEVVWRSEPAKGDDAEYEDDIKKVRASLEREAKAKAAKAAEEGKEIAVEEIPDDHEAFEKAKADKASYASPILVEYGGIRMILTMSGKGLVGVNADTGKLLFRYAHKTTHDAAVANPIFHDGQVFISTGYGTTGSAMVKLTVDGEKVTAEKVWGSKELDNHHGGVVLIDGYLYGAAHKFNKAKWICLDWKTGEMKWAEKGVGKGSCTYAEGLLYTLSSAHQMGIAKPTPDGHEIISQFEIPDLGKSTSRGHPVVIGGRLYIRHNDYLYAWDIKAPE